MDGRSQARVGGAFAAHAPFSILVSSLRGNLRVHRFRLQAFVSGVREASLLFRAALELELNPEPEPEEEEEVLVPSAAGAAPSSPPGPERPGCEGGRRRLLGAGPDAMKLYSLSVLYKGDAKAVLLKAAYDVSSFSFFQRSSVQEFMTFTSQLIVERSEKGSRASVKEQEYLCHVYVRNDSLAGVVIADNEYPSRVAFTLLEKVLDEFSKQVDKIDWPVGSPATIHYAALDSYLSRYQNPREADPMTKVQAELDETKIILHNTMESLLERGEKLDDLVSKSEVLGTQSKAFYKTARKQNSCCEIM